MQLPPPAHGATYMNRALAESATLAARYELPNLDVRALPIERVGELGASFDFILSTGVLHHLVDQGNTR